MTGKPPKSKLQALIKGGVIPEDMVHALTQEQRQKIETLTKQQVDAVVMVHEMIGPVDGLGFI